MAKVIPQKVSEAKVSYVLYPFDRAKTSKEGHHSPLKKVKKKKKNKYSEAKCSWMGSLIGGETLFFLFYIECSLSL